MRRRQRLASWLRPRTAIASSYLLLWGILFGDQEEPFTNTIQVPRHRAEKRRDQVVHQVLQSLLLQKMELQKLSCGPIALMMEFSVCVFFRADGLWALPQPTILGAGRRDHPLLRRPWLVLQP